MRQALLVLGVLAVFAIAVPTSSSQRAAAQNRVTCGLTKQATFLFWPLGHPAVPSVGFPEFLFPHLEIYRPGAAYPNSNFLGFAAFANGQAATQFAKTCKSVVGAKPLRARIAHSKTSTEATALTCRFARAVQFDGSVTTAGPRVQVIEPAAKVSGTLVPASTSVVVSFTSTGGALYYNSAECQPGAPPSG